MAEFVSSFVPAGTSNPNPPTLSSTSPTVAGLAALFLAWVDSHRESRTHKERARHLSRFGAAHGGDDAGDVRPTHLDSFRDSLRVAGFAPEYVRKHEVSVRACFAWGVKHGHLPPGFAPFVTVEATCVPKNPLLESDLPTDAEVKAILAHAKGGMKDILVVYHATGARTHELIEARCGDYQPGARQLVLGKHKRSKTLRNPIPRTITLNATANAILARRCEGRATEAPLFANRVGCASSGWEIARRFVTVRKHADIRPEITIYSFRHLWISEALMAGLDALLVARMAGTSVKMIETTYGHFKASTFQDAQARLDAARRR
jgi:integrase